MKKITLFISATLVFGLISCEEHKEVPQVVKDAFATKFSSATDVEWDKESDTEWEAEFEKDSREHSANFLQDGTWIETEYEISKTDVPSNVMDVFNLEFEDYETEGIELSLTAKGTAYEFSIEKDEEEFEVVIDTSGNIIKKKKGDNDKDEEEDDNEDND